VNEEDKEEKDPLLEEGEHLFVMQCQPRDKEIRVVATNSQHLTEEALAAVREHSSLVGV
jgi:hypothetical protein